MRHGPLRGAAHVHVLDEAHLGVTRAAKLDQIDEFVLVDAANDHRVDLERSELACRRRDALAHAVELVESGELAKAIVPQRVETHRDAMEAGGTKRARA